MKSMTPQHKAALISGRADHEKAIRAKCESQIIVIDENWSIVRLDERNWSIHNKRAEKDGFENDNFFGSLFAAFKALPAKMLSAEAGGTIQQVLDCQNGIRARIIEALRSIEKAQSSDLQ